MTSKQAQREKRIRLSDKKRQAIHDLWESEGMKVLKNDILPQRQIRLMKVGLEMSQTMEHVREERGRIKEHSWIVDFIHNIYNEVQAEEGTENV